MSMLKLSNRCALLLAALTAVSVSTQAAEKNLGYTDTPFLPGQKWRVHDGTRPQPPVVTPGAKFSDMAPAPADAIVLFDGKDLSKWTGDGGQARWKVENGYMEANHTGSIQTKDEFGDFQLHVEFASPEKVEGSSQGRGNSGVFLHGRYEVQVLDSFNNPTYPDGQAGALYGQQPPRVNAVRGPGQWQTYDIVFEGPRFEGDKLVKPAYVTVILNGVVLHHRQELIGTSVHQAVGKYSPYNSKGPIALQDHQNPTRFRNIWIRPLREYDRP